MSDERQGVIGSLPSTRPHRRSDKRAPAAGPQTEPADQQPKPSAPTRARAKTKATKQSAAGKPATTKKTPAAKPVTAKKTPAAKPAAAKKTPAAKPAAAKKVASAKNPSAATKTARESATAKTTTKPATAKTVRKPAAAKADNPAATAKAGKPAAETTPEAAEPIRATARRPAAKKPPANVRTRTRVVAPPPTPPPSPPPATTPASRPADEQHGTLETVVQAAAELTEIGLRAGARALRGVVSRLPRP